MFSVGLILILSLHLTLDWIPDTITKCAQLNSANFHTGLDCIVKIHEFRFNILFKKCVWFKILFIEYPINPFSLMPSSTFTVWIWLKGTQIPTFLILILYPTNRCALLMIDWQKDFLDTGGFGHALGNDVTPLQAALRPAAAVLAAARAARVAIQ